MKKDQVRLLTDTNLSTEARTVALYISSLGEGEHEVPFAQFRRLLNQAGEKKVRTAVDDAAEVGWITRREGGRGHHTRFAFTPAKGAYLSDRSAKAAEVSEDTSAKAADLKAPVVVGEGVVVNPPIVPPVGDEAEKAIEGNTALLAGCRGALRDYLGQRVPRERQSGFVWAVVGWMNLNGFAWQNDEGTVVPPGARPGLLANALNQLLASEEKGYKAPVGDPRNVLQKLRIICGQHGIERKHGHHGNGTSGANGGGGGTSAAGGKGKGGRVFTEYVPAAASHAARGDGA